MENDTSAGNLVDLLPIEVQKRDFDLSFLDNLSEERPRLLVQGKDLADFRAKVQADESYCMFDDFFNNSTKKFLDTAPYEEPQAYPEETVGKASLWRPYWRQMYVDCQMALNATRNLSIAGIVKEDEELIAKAKAWTLKLSTYDPEGVTSRGYNDEAAFRVIAAMAWGYDWLNAHFTDEERQQVQDALIERLDEIMHHLRVTVDLLNNPLNSHGVRSISSAIIQRVSRFTTITRKQASTSHTH
ncbi:oligo alginate lyase [Vibrio ishigakensis]|uniref:Oligo alginate lyase n=1 Tax=Vibrio ishigakensis TaxID=1481914 RepID=A0A0B8QE50_9VIBR|nr:oligo alginate lyase [Vibrio ishigakensis]